MVERPGATGATGAVSAEGVIERGVECPRVRLPDGRTFSLQGGAVSRLRAALVPGTRIRLVGRPVGMSTCQQGATLAVQEIEIIAAP